ncbi:MAG: hypothetical protein ABF258_01760 [Flavobacteriales bacterium]
MEILKLATEWAKSEVFSTRFFIFFAILFLTASIGFWQIGKTEMAKAYIIPTLVAGILLMTIGIGLFYTNKSRVTAFESAFKDNVAAFVESENERIESTLQEYKTVVFKAIPIIIILAAVAIIFFSSPTWRAISITSIAMLVVILLVDGTAHSRIENYNKELKIETEKTIHNKV